MSTRRRLDLVYLVLAVAGIVVAGILTSFHFIPGAKAAYCTAAAGCGTVNDSVYAKVLGVPVSLGGLVAYLVIAGLALASLRGWSRREWAPVAVFGLSLAGVLYSAYLTYVELFVLHAVCPCCVASAVIMTVIFVVSLLDLFWLRAGPDPARRRA